MTKARYRVTCNMMSGVARGARVQCVVSDGHDPYSTDDKAHAEKVAAGLRALPEGYRNVRVEQVQP